MNKYVILWELKFNVEVVGQDSLLNADLMPISTLLTFVQILANHNSYKLTIILILSKALRCHSIHLDEEFVYVVCHLSASFTGIPQLKPVSFHGNLDIFFK